MNSGSGRDDDLTFGSSPEITHPTLNYYREMNKKQVEEPTEKQEDPRNNLLFTLIQPDLFGGQTAPEHQRGPLAKEFLWSPFTVFNAQSGAWQERKNAWLQLGIKGEEGRGTDPALDSGAGRDDNLLKRSPQTAQINFYSEQKKLDSGAGRVDLNPTNRVRKAAGTAVIDFYEQKRKLEAEMGRTLTYDEAKALIVGGLDSAAGRGDDLMRSGASSVYNGRSSWSGTRGGGRPMAFRASTFSDEMLAAAPELTALMTRANGTSIFDPVLCEVMYRWFCPAGGLVLDPFAGGSVRGIVASFYGYHYLGVDLSERQLAANEEQATLFGFTPRPQWLLGDAWDLEALWPAGQADFIFTCPPYADLEQYSDDPRDLSTMDYPDFIERYSDIVTRAMWRLKPDRFACIVVGDLRDTKTGFYRNFVADTVDAMQGSGAQFYNDAVLITAIGSLPLRVPTQFRVGRKLGKTHQNILMFVKGDWRRATQACQTKAEVAKDVEEGWKDIPTERPVSGPQEEAYELDL